MIITPDTNFLDFFTLPALQTLEVSEYVLQEDPDADPIASLQSLISRSSCKIWELYITHAEIAPAFYQLALPMVGEIKFGRKLPGVYPFTIALPEEDDRETWDGDFSEVDSERASDSDDLGYW
ncbi:hypothetical protein C8R46DRAFT_1029641 [Mycena filopes]|nr:hypothetical protein C8R46DRAFT_1029641 [Mycena filopes]